MLCRLYIENIAVIERSEIIYSKGLNIMTGETGAGKSILIDSIMAVMGERTSKELIRSGAASAFVSAEFTDISQPALAYLEELGIEAQDGVVILSRELKVDGRGACRVNGRPVSASTLKQAGGYLVNIHGQHDTQALMKQEEHIKYIDAMLPDLELKKAYKEEYARLTAVRNELSSLQMDEAEKARMTDMLRYQINEIEAAHPRPGETEKLKNFRDKCRNFEKIRSALEQACELISGNEDVNGAASLVSSASVEIGSISNYNADFERLSSRLSDASYELADIADELRVQLGSMDFDPSKLEAVEERLDLLYRITKKYGGEQEALEYCEKAAERLEKIEYSDERRAELTSLLEERMKRAAGLAEKLTQARRETAKVFSDNICRELSFLDMPGVSFLAQIGEKTPASDGADTVEFLISTNPGEPPKPMSKIASGGELSRIMLAIKNVLAEHDTIDTLIFDEIDSGVSGRAAHKIGVKLKQASKSHQIICITHLAQIAANADSHMLIRKEVQDGRTYTQVVELDYGGRVNELARITGGESITRSQLETAREMLESAGILS